MRPIVIITTAAGPSTPAPMDIYARPQISLQLTVTGGGTCTVEQTLDDVFDPKVTPVWLPHPDTNLVAVAAGTKQGNYGYVPRAVRLNQTGAGTGRLTIIQPGIIG